MELSYQTICNVLEALGCEHVYDQCSEYGEPGYSTSYDAVTPLVVLGDWWCRCDEFGTNAQGYNELHGLDRHHPRLFAQLEVQGVELVWHDEWMVDYEGDKAYRTQGDSYHWQPSVLWTECGDPLFPDSDPEEIITYVVNDPHKCVTAPFGGWKMLIDNGFVQYPDESASSFESGWHPGQDDDPQTITNEIRRVLGDDVEIAFAIDETSQFYTRFSAYVRHPQD